MAAPEFADKRIICPTCQKSGTLIKDSYDKSDNPGWVCWKNNKTNPGCGAKVTSEELINLGANLGPAPVESEDKPKFDNRLDDYATVVERLRKFTAKYPEGRIQSNPPQLFTVTGKYPEGKLKGKSDKTEQVFTVREQTYMSISVAVYKDPSDSMPSIAFAWEPVPGLTPYTHNSELNNAETSALGRALAHMGFDISKAIASRSEVQNRIAEGGQFDDNPTNLTRNADPAPITMSKSPTHHATHTETDTSDDANRFTIAKVLATIKDPVLEVSEPPAEEPKELCPYCGHKVFRLNNGGYFCKKNKDTGACGERVSMPITAFQWAAKSHSKTTPDPDNADLPEAIPGGLDKEQTKILAGLAMMPGQASKKAKAAETVRDAKRGLLEFQEALDILLDYAKGTSPV